MREGGGGTWSERLAVREGGICEKGDSDILVR